MIDRQAEPPPGRAGAPQRRHAPGLAAVLLALSPAPAAADGDIATAVRSALAPAAVLSWQRAEEEDGDVTLSDVTLRPFGADEAAGWMAVERVALVGGTTDDVEPGFLPRFERVTLERVRLYAPDQRGNATIEEIVLDDVTLPAGVVAAIVVADADDPAAAPEETADDDTADDGTADTDAADDPAATAPSDAPPEGSAHQAPGDELPLETMLAALRIGRAVATDIRQFEPLQGEATETLRLSELRLEDVADGRIGALTAEALAIDTVQGGLALDRFAFADLDMLAAAALSTAADALEMPEDGAVSLDPGLTLVEAANFALTDPSGDDLLRFDRITLDELSRIDGRLVAGRLRVAELTMPVPALDEPALEAMLAAMDYDRLTASIEFRASIDPDAETLTVAPVVVGLDDMASASAAFSMGQFDLEELMGQLQRLGGSGLPALPRATFAGFELAMTDDGLTDRLLDHVSGERPDDREALIADTVAAVTGVLEAQRITGRLHDEAAAAVDAFLRDPARLVVRADPASPVPLLELGIGFVAAPDTTMNRLGAEIVYEDRP